LADGDGSSVGDQRIFVCDQGFAHNPALKHLSFETVIA
jgi:hypothetical protein